MAAIPSPSRAQGRAARDADIAGATTKSVYAAMIANFAIAATKFAAAGFSGSAAMLSEAIHSLVDTGNEALMLYGLRSARKPPDARHPFGYGHEVYFWTLVVGVLIFALGGGMSIVTGLQHIARGEIPGHSGWSYAVLAMAAIFEGVSWLYALKAFRAEQRGRGVVQTIRLSKDPTTFAVLLEDSAALVGIAIAFAGIFLSERLQAPWIDGASSVLIGLLLAGIAFVMVRESKGLLVGEGMEPATLEALRAIVREDPEVECVDSMLTLYLGPHDVMLAMEVRFRADAPVIDARSALTRVRRTIQERYPRIRRVFLDVTTDAE
jgi:cation diffusion facilitator family transporter